MCDSHTRPAFIPAPNTARFRLEYTIFGQQIENVLYWQKGSPFIASDLSALISEVNTAWDAHIKPLLPTACNLSGYEATALDTAIAPQVTSTQNKNGTGGTDPLPTGSTLAIKFASGLTGRSSRGRMFWPVLDTTQVSGDQVTDLFATDVITAITAFFDDIETALGDTHVIVSYCHAGAWRTTAVNTPVLDYVLTDKNIDSQRRRLAGRGI